MITVLLSSVSFLCCLLAFCLHSAHLYLLFVGIPTCAEHALDRSQSPSWLLSLMDVTKERNDQFTCVCPLPQETAAATSIVGSGGSGGGGDHHGVVALTYVGLSCIEVKRVLPVILTVEGVLNFVGLFISAWFAGLVTFSKKSGSKRREEWRGGGAEAGGKKTVAAKGVSADAETALSTAATQQDGIALLQS